MNLKDILAKEISKKRQQVTELSNGKKYIKREELEKVRVQQYYQASKKEQEDQEDTTKDFMDRKTNIEDFKNEIRDCEEIEEERNAENDSKLSSEEITTRLRKLSQPVKLFGESEKKRYERLLRLENRDEHAGQQNEFMKRMSELEGSASNAESQRKTITDPVLLIKSSDTEIVSRELAKENIRRAGFLVSVYFKRLLHEWQEELDFRPETEKQSMKGKIDTVTFTQTADSMKMFFEKLLSNKLQDDVVIGITEIVGYVQQREYVKATDAYLQLSIGNAP
jgi:pre-mRNA-splicing factor 18